MWKCWCKMLDVFNRLQKIKFPGSIIKLYFVLQGELTFSKHRLTGLLWTIPGNVVGSFFSHSAKKLKYKLPSPFLGWVPSMPCMARSRLLLLVNVEEVEPSVPSQIQPFPVMSSSLICWNTVSASWRTILMRFTLAPDSFSWNNNHNKFYFYSLQLD